MFRSLRIDTSVKSHIRSPKAATPDASTAIVLFRIIRTAAVICVPPTITERINPGMINERNIVCSSAETGMPSPFVRRSPTPPQIAVIPMSNCRKMSCLPTRVCSYCFILSPPCQKTRDKSAEEFPQYLR